MKWVAKVFSRITSYNVCYTKLLRVMAALRARKHVMVEKPLCINEEELEEIRTYYESIPGTKPLLMVGFNRGFAPATRDSLLRITSYNVCYTKLLRVPDTAV